jgi:AraC-like DNA-binding protein
VDRAAAILAAMTHGASKFGPSLRARAVRPLVDGFRALGLDVEALLREAGIDPNVLSDVEHRIAHAQVMILWQHAVQRSADPLLGVHAAAAAPLESFDLHAYAMLASNDLRDALRRACRYHRLIHDSTALRFEERDDEGVIVHSLGDGRAVPRQPAEFLAALWCRFGRLVAADAWRPRLLCFDHAAPVDTREHARLFGCPIVFGGGPTALHLPNRTLDAPNQRRDPAMVALLDRHAQLLLDRAPHGTPVAARVRDWVIERLSSGEPSATRAAQALGLSARSLQRRLSEEGTSFRAVVDRLRLDQSRRLLAESDLSIAEIGFVLGFSELSAFHRAFKRWTGLTPLEHRQRAWPQRSME